MSFTARLRQQPVKAALVAGLALPGGGFAQQQPLPVPPEILQQIHRDVDGTDECRTLIAPAGPVRRAGMLVCGSPTVPLEGVTDYIRDHQRMNHNELPPSVHMQLGRSKTGEWNEVRADPAKLLELEKQLNHAGVPAGAVLLLHQPGKTLMGHFSQPDGSFLLVLGTGVLDLKTEDVVGAVRSMLREVERETAQPGLVRI